MSDLPAPLTPANCDLRGMPFMPVDIVRLFDSDLYALSTGEEFKAAFTLWGRAFLQVPAGSLPADDRILAHLSGAGVRWPRVKDLALRGWIPCSDGRLYHPVVAEKAREAWEARLAQRARTEAARAARAAKRQGAHDECDTPHATRRTDNAAASVTENATGHATGSKGQGQGQGQKEIPAASPPEFVAARRPSPPPAEALLDRAATELGLNLADLRRNLDWINLPIRVAEWRRQGATDADIWPTMRRIQAKKGELPKSPAYFAAAVIEAKDRRIAEQGHAATVQAAEAALPADHPTTKSRLAHFRETGQWFEDWGQRPQETAA